MAKRALKYDVIFKENDNNSKNQDVIRIQSSENYDKIRELVDIILEMEESERRFFTTT